MNITLSSVLSAVAIVLFVAAALIVDGHVNYGNAFVVGFVGLATMWASKLAHDEGY